MEGEEDTREERRERWIRKGGRRIVGKKGGRDG